MKKIVLTVAAVIIIIFGSGIYFIYSGIYNVAATSKDSPIVHWILHTTMEQSVERRAEGITPSKDFVLTDPATIHLGFNHYKEMCVICHGGPGVKPGEARAGLNPKPPLLAKIVKGMSPGELFWVIKNGIKMTGMPAWGPTHSDDKIWAIVAFVKKLPGLTATDYRKMQQQIPDSGDEHDKHEEVHKPASTTL